MTDDIRQKLPGVIGDLQGGVQDILADEESQLDKKIPVLCENQQDLVQRINETVAQAKPGICAIIRSPSFNDTRFGAQLYFDDVDVIIRIIENVLLNRGASGTQIPAQLAAEQIARTINNAIPKGFGAALVPYRISEVTDVRQAGVLMYEVRAKTAVGLDQPQSEGEES